MTGNITIKHNGAFFVRKIRDTIPVMPKRLMLRNVWNLNMEFDPVLGLNSCRK